MRQILKIKRINGKIITNPIPKWKISLKKTNNKINIASLSNYDSERGTDRIIEVASMIPHELRKYYIFHMIGDYKLNKILKNIFSQKNNLINSVRPVHALGPSERSQNALDHTSRLFNPYLAPTAVLVENKKMAQNSFSPSYQNNVAVTKYMNVSAVPKVRAHTQTSLIA